MEELCGVTNGAGHWAFTVHSRRLLCFAFDITPGYAKNYKSLKQFLEASPLGNEIKVVGKEDKGVTGNFEVTVGKEDPVVVHSKRHAGQGRASSDEERAAILEQLEEILDDSN